jgi:glutaredoxin
MHTFGSFFHCRDESGDNAEQEARHVRELCKSHHLALAPDGKCILCRRPALTVFAVRPETEDALSRVVTGVLGACLLAAFVGLVYAWRLDPTFASGSQANAPRWTELPVERAASRAAPGPARATEPVAAAPGPRAPASHRGPLPPLAPEVTRGSIRIVMYSAPWCYVCDRARDFLHADVVELVERDVERDPSAARALAARNPMQTLPTFEVSGETLVGFSPYALEQAVRTALMPVQDPPAVMTALREPEAAR